MQILEHGQAQERTLLFFPCTAEPVWAFADTITLLSQRWHVFQVVYDGHQPEYPGDFTSVEQTVDEVISYLKSHGVSRLGGAYGCSMGGACLTRMLALGEMPIDRAIIDGGITPYQLLYPVRKLLLWRDILSFKMAANSRKILEAAFPPERFTPAGHDPKKEYDAMEAYLKTFSDRTIRNIFWSANNYALPKCPAKTGTKLTYWYGDDEKRDRRRDIQFIKRYFPQARIHGIPKMAHAELVMVHPEKFCWYAEKFLTLQTEEAWHERKNQTLRRAGDHAADRLCQGEGEPGARRDSRCKSGRNHRETGLRFFPCRQGHSHAQRRHCPNHRARPDDEGMACVAPRRGGGQHRLRAGYPLLPDVGLRTLV